MSQYVSRKDFEAALPRHRNTKQPLWSLDVEEIEGDQIELAYQVPILYDGKPTTKSVFVDATQYGDGIYMPGVEISCHYFNRGEWHLWRGYDPKDSQLVPMIRTWDKWLVETIRWLYKPAYEEEAHYLNRSRPTKPKPAPKTKPKPKHTPIVGKRTPVVGQDVATKPKAAKSLVVLALASLQFTPSDLQLAVWNYIETNTRNLVVEALAGSGKTTTIVEALKIVPGFLSAAFVAFNRRIANTLKEMKAQGKLPQHVHVSTLHSLGLGNLTKAYGIKDLKSYITKFKTLDIVKGIVLATRETDELTAEKIHGMRYTIQDLVSIIKSTMSKPNAEDILYLSDRYGIELNGDFDLLVKLVEQVFAKSVEMIPYQIDYDDMIYACAIGMVACRKFDVMFVDECQDLNMAQIQFVLKCAHRIVAVGDRHQSIYGFRGADTEAMDKLISMLDAHTLPLSITYRCPRSHVEYIRNRLPHIPIEAAPGAIEGVIGNKLYDDLIKEAKTGDLVLCRCNAPLVGPAFELIRAGKKAVILGRDIGEGLILFMEKIAEKSGKTSLLDILHEMAEYVSNERAKLLDANKTNLAQLLTDKHETIIALADGCATVAEVKAKIKLVFSNDEEGVVFSSVHKAKGCEADRVYILALDLMPHPNASQDWELVQEWNIWYVAHSRSKNELYFVA